ncbi:hypothetical protein GCM10010392_63550 [Streptomyces clavifer]|nr:hypothetical protein GCM10010392_63550 [Streptomyces clavifer]
MLRVHFTPEDLARVRVAPGPDFLQEIGDSVQTLQSRDGERVFGAWRHRVRPRLSGRGRRRSAPTPARPACAGTPEDGVAAPPCDGPGDHGSLWRIHDPSVNPM